MEYERKYLERCFHIYTSRYFHTAITYKLQNVFQYSVSIQYNYFDTVFHTMYFNTAQLCLWPMTFFGLTGRICPLLVHATSRLPFILHLSPYQSKFLLWVATRGRERVIYCVPSLVSVYTLFHSCSD